MQAEAAANTSYDGISTGYVFVSGSLEVFNCLEILHLALVEIR